MEKQTKPPSQSGTDWDEVVPWAALGVLVLVVIWGYWNSLCEVALEWQRPQYSHGWLIPAFTIALLWMRLNPLGPVRIAERWWGLGVVAVSLALRVLTAFYSLEVPEMMTLVPTLIGCFLLVGGWKALRWAGPAVAFLIFMFPLPWSVENALLVPLQNIATKASTYALQTMGIGAYHVGNHISIEKLTLGVVDACSGLRMTTIFVALSVAIVLVTDRPWWERLIVLVSAIPIAIIVNVTRITVTGLAHLYVGKELADKIFHDWAGWLMVPMALILLFLELKILTHLFVEVEPVRPVPVAPVGRRGRPRSRAPA
jgi:exosortase